MRPNKYKAIDFCHLDEETMEGDIITNFMHDDFYKYLMGQLIWKHPKYRNAKVCWHFKNRTKNVLLGKHISEKAFGDQIDALRKLKLESTEHHFLAGTFEYDTTRMFDPGYLSDFKNFTWPTVQFGKTDDGQLDVKVMDRWLESSLMEIAVLTIINKLYYRSLLSGLSRIKREAVYAEGIKRLAARIEKLKDHPYVQFSDFGNRRSFSSPWHDYVVSRVAEELPGQFKGTSATSLAMKHGLMPVGTCAHEISMIITALMFRGGTADIGHIQDVIQNQWHQQYGDALNIALPDTYGTRFCLAAYSDETVRNLRGVRIDSMNPIEAITLLQERFKAAGTDHRSKLYIPSDGLDVDPMIEISSRFKGEGVISHGFGTMLTNDMGLGQLSIVMKPYSVNDEYCVKLSDNLAKATGNSAAIAQYKKAIGYDLAYEATCKV